MTKIKTTTKTKITIKSKIKSKTKTHSRKTGVILRNREVWAPSRRSYLEGLAIRISPSSTFWPGSTVNSVRISGPVWPRTYMV